MGGFLNSDRPVSPHLGVYRFGLSAFLSIIHRMTSVLIFLGLVEFSWFFILSGYAPDSRFVMFAVSFFPTLASRVFSFLWISCLIYHSSNGVRHLLSDLDFMVTNEGAKISGLCMLSFVILSVSCVFYILFL